MRQSAADGGNDSQQTQGSRGQMLPALVSSSLVLNLKPDSLHSLPVCQQTSFISFIPPLASGYKKKAEA
jgi:hypothetical protein